MSSRRPSAECIICAGETRPLPDDKLRIVHDVCTVCGFTRKQPRFHPGREAEKAVYDTHHNTMENEGYVRMLEDFLDRAVRPYRTTGKALDFGCGPGPVLYELLLRRGFSVRRYDPFYHPDKTVFQDTYGVVTATEVFEHLRSPLAETERLASLLEPGGILAVMTKLRPPADEDFLAWWYRRDVSHIGFFTSAAFGVLAEKAGLCIRHTDREAIVVMQKGVRP